MCLFLSTMKLTRVNTVIQVAQVCSSSIDLIQLKDKNTVLMSCVSCVLKRTTYL